MFGARRGPLKDACLAPAEQRPCDQGGLGKVRAAPRRDDPLLAAIELVEFHNLTLGLRSAVNVVICRDGQMTGGDSMETLIELTETELDAVAGGQVFANQYLEATAIG